jgi:hypothetical protein
MNHEGHEVFGHNGHEVLATKDTKITKKRRSDLIFVLLGGLCGRNFVGFVAPVAA